MPRKRAIYFPRFRTFIRRKHSFSLKVRYYTCSYYFRPFKRTIRLWTFSGFVARGELTNLAIHPVMFFFYLLKYCDYPKTKLYTQVRSWYSVYGCVVCVESFKILNLYCDSPTHLPTS
jgi:hypothetical protein